jgi:hypothetical protein
MSAQNTHIYASPISFIAKSPKFSSIKGLSVSSSVCMRWANRANSVHWRLHWPWHSSSTLKCARAAVTPHVALEAFIFRACGFHTQGDYLVAHV